ncbi:9806_t:CDS:2, partial [Cetraspora pellucida]
AIAVVQESDSPEKHKEIVSKQKDDGSIELDDSICKELHAPKEEIIDTIKGKITNPKLKLPEFSSSLATAIDLSYLKNAADKYKGDWVDKYNKARDYLSKQIGDADAEKELLDCADEYVIDKTTNKVIEEKKMDVIDLKKDEIPKEENPKAKAKSFFGSLYEGAVKLDDQIEKALGFSKDKELDDHEKAEALIVVEESASREKCNEIVTDQKDDGCIELSDTICNELDTPKEEIITTIKPKLTNKIHLPKLPSILSTATNLSYLKKTAPQHEGEWKDKYDKARKYISDQIGDANVEKELLECTDDYVVDNCIKKVIKDKKRNAVATVQESATPEKCDDVVSNQNNDGSFEVNETICKDIDVPVTNVVTEVKKCTQNPKLRSPKSEPWWKTGLTTSYLNIAAPHHKKQWEDKHDKARKYLSDQIGDADAEKELLDCTDKYLVDNITKKVEKDHKKKAAIAVIQESASREKHKEIVSKQKDDGSIEINDSICKELHAPKEEIIDTIKENITNPKLKLPESSSSLATAVNLSYLKNAADKYKGDWVDKYNKARDYLSKQIGDADAEKELLDCADEYVIDKTTNKVIEEKKMDVIDLKKDEIPKEENPKAKARSFFGSLYDGAVKLDDQIEKALGFNKDKELDDHEKAEALIVVEQSASREKCKEVVADQKVDGCIELSDTVCDELGTSKEENITTIQPKLTNKLQLPNLPSILSTATNISYLKKTAPQHEGVWKDKYDKARKYLSDQIGDTNVEKELLECTDDYVVDNCIKKVIKDKKRNAVSTVQESATPEKCNDIVSNQNNDGSFEVSETICKEIDVPATDVVTEVKECTQNPKLKSPESEPWWKTALTTSYLNIAAPHHKKQWEDKHDKARKYLSDQIGDADAEKELLDCTDKYLVDNITKKVEKDHKKKAAIAVIQESASREKHKEIVSKQKDDGSIEIDDSICMELLVPKEDIINTIKKKITNPKLKLPEHSSSLATAVNLSYLKNAADKYKGDWVDKYNKARDYLSKQIGDAHAEKELLDCADEYVIDKTTDKLIEEKKKYVIDLKKDEILKKETPKAKSFFRSLYERAVKLVDQIEKALGFNKDKLDDHEKAEALIIVEESASPEKCKKIVADQKDDGCIELSDIVCDELDTPKEEIITTIQPKLTNKKLQLPNLPSIIATAINLSYLMKAAPKYEGVWKDKHDKSRKYLSDQIGDEDAEKELLECTDDYVVDSCIRRVIKDKKRNAVAAVQESTTPEKCNDVVSKQNNDGSFEVSETICKEIDVPVTNVVNEVKKCTQNPKLRTTKSEQWWKTALATSYLNIAAPHHKEQWKDKHDKARKYLSDQIDEPVTETELLDCTDKYLVDNITKKVEKDHKKEAAIAVIQESASPDKHEEIVSKQKDDGSIELDNSICKELHATKEEIIDTIREKITNPKLKLHELSSSLATAVNLSYLKNVAPKYKTDWIDEYNKARDYLSKQIGDLNAEKELLDYADEYVIDKITDKVIEERKKYVIDLKKDEIPKEENPKAKSFFSSLYERAVKLVDQIEKVLGLKDKLDDHEKAEALIIVEESASPEKCKEIVADQKEDGCIELSDTVCDELDLPKEEIITTIQPKLTNKKLQLPNLSSILATAINLSYLKKAASQHEGEWKDKYNKARKYLSDQIEDTNAEKELLECTDDYVVDNCIKKVIKDKKRNAVVMVQESITPEKCDEIMSNQNNDGSFEVSETICKDIDVPVVNVVNEVKKCTQNPKLKSPETEPWWKTALTTSYLNIAAPNHKKRWKDKHDKARKYLSDQIGEPATETELLDCTDKYLVDNITKKVENDHKKEAAIAVIQESASDKHEEIVSKQKDDGSIELDDSICKELHATKEEIIDTIREKITNPKLKLPELSPSFATAVNLSYLKNAAAKYKAVWIDKYNKACDYLSKQIGDVNAEKELLDYADEYVIDKIINKVIEEKKNFFGSLYEGAVKLVDKIEKVLGFNKDKLDDHEKAEALIIVEESASPEKCKEIVADQKDDGCIELSDTVCDELDTPKEEIITTIQPKLTNKKLQLPNLSSILATAINLSYLMKAASQHEGEWKDKYDKARKYLSDQLGDTNVEKELLECTDDYVINNCIKKVIKDKKRDAVATVQESTTPEKCDDIVSNQNDDGSFEVSEKICIEIDVPVTKVVSEVKKGTQNPKLRSPKSEPWWQTALAISYLNIAAPHHKKQWEDKHDKARKYLSDQIGEPATEKELLDCTDKYLVDNITKKVEKDHKKKAAIAVIQESVSPDKHKGIVSKQKDDGSIEIDDSICKELHAPKEEIIETIREKITNPKLKLLEFSSSLATAINLSYLTNVASKYKGEWIDKYNKACDYLSKQIGDVDAEKELLDCTDEYVVDKVTNKVIEEQKKKVIAMKKDEITLLKRRLDEREFEEKDLKEKEHGKEKEFEVKNLEVKKESEKQKAIEIQKLENDTNESVIKSDGAPTFNEKNKTNNLKTIDQNVYAEDLELRFENTRSTKLDFSYYNLDAEIEKALIKALRTNKSIVCLSLSYNRLEMGEDLVNSLRTNNTLISLSLKSTRLETKVMKKLLMILKTNKSITDLDLSDQKSDLDSSNPCINGEDLVETLEQNTTLVSLNLSNNSIDWSEIKSTTLNKNETLKNLDLSNCNIDFKIIELENFLIKLKSLEKLNLSSNNLTFRSEKAIAKILTENKSLKTLNLSSNKINLLIELEDKQNYDAFCSFKLTEFENALNKSQALKNLDLSFNYLHLEAGRSLLRALRINKSITDLNLSDNHIVSEIGNSLLEIKSIVRINLKSTKISSDVIKAFADALRINKIKLRSLNLSNNEISKDVIRLLIGALEENVSLEELDLSHIIEVGKLGEELKNSLEKNRTLKILNLSHCCLRANTIKALENTLLKNITISNLDLSYNNISITSLFKALERNNTLTKLNISHKDLDFEEGKALASALKINNTLTHLYLSETINDSETGKVFVEALGKNKKLAELDLSNNCFNLEVAIALTKALEINESLRNIDLRNNKRETKNELKKWAKYKNFSLNVNIKL